MLRKDMQMTEIETLRTECLSCRKCVIGGVDMDGHLSNVFSTMNPASRIMVVGQNPGREEVEKGEPFVGASGRFFEKATKDVLGMDRSCFYISNTVRCFTMANRSPSLQEIENCRPFMDREVMLVRPKVIISLGAPAFKNLTGMGGIMKHHGKPIVSVRYGVVVIPLLHPSPLNMNDPKKRKMFYDGLTEARRFLDENDSRAQD